MQFLNLQLPLLTTLLLLPSLAQAQVAAGGGVAATTLAATQYPTVVVGPTKVIVGSSTSVAQNVAFTQTFKSPLVAFAFATPSAGVIGLGNIQGTVGAVKKPN